MEQLPQSLQFLHQKMQSDLLLLQLELLLLQLLLDQLLLHGRWWTTGCGGCYRRWNGCCRGCRNRCTVVAPPCLWGCRRGCWRVC